MRKQILSAAIVAGCAVGSSAFAADIGANTTVDGQVFADFGHITEQQNGVDVAPTGTGFDVKRAYLIVNHTFDDIWSANLTTDAQFINTATNTGLSNSTTASSGGVTEIFIKLLYLQAKFNDAFVVHAGSYASPWVDYVQGLYGYRFVEKTTLDRLGFANTADWGLNATGTAGDNGLFSYSASVVDGGGYKNPTRTKDVDVEARVAVKPVSWLSIGAGVYNGHLGQVNQTNADYASNTATRWDGAVGVIWQGLRVGAEYFDAKNYKTASATTGVVSGPAGVVVASSATGAVVSDEADGVSAWASYAFTKQWAVFARYDDVKFSKDVDPNLKDQYFHVGVDFKPINPLDFALVYKHEKVTDGTISISSGDGNASYTLGGTGTTASGTTTSGQFDEIGIYTQYNF